MTAHRAVATDDGRPPRRTLYKAVHCNGYYVLGEFHKYHLFFPGSAYPGNPRFVGYLYTLTRFYLISPKGFKENFLSFFGTNRRTAAQGDSESVHVGESELQRCCPWWSLEFVSIRSARVGPPRVNGSVRITW